jgi:ferritin
MVVSDKMVNAINAQIGREFGASLQYVSIASHFDRESLPELASFFYRQAEEERDHAMKFVHYLVDAGGHARLPGVAAPKQEFASAEEAVKLSLDWEQEVTRQINDLVDLALKENDHQTKTFLDWFVNEQLEEVSNMDHLLNTIRRAGEQGLLFVEAYIARQRGLAPTKAEAGA